MSTERVRATNHGAVAVAVNTGLDWLGFAHLSWCCRGLLLLSFPSLVGIPFDTSCLPLSCIARLPVKI
jgi:hypothetical protein